MQNPIARDDINIRSSWYFLAHTLAACGHCRAPTQLFALAVPPGHEALEPDYEVEPEEPGAYTWRIAEHHAFLFQVGFLPSAVQSRLKPFARSGRFKFSDASCYWANHCERCGTLLDDHELFCEPEGAFLPTNESQASLICLQTIDEAFEAAAAGYAYEPQFFDAMSRT